MADEETREILLKWNFEELIDTFKASKITINRFKLLDDASIKQLIPIIGDQLEFTFKWKNLFPKDTIHKIVLSTSRETPASDNEDCGENMKLSIDEREKEQKKIVNVNKEVEILRNWLTKQAHLPQDLNDDFLTFYILGTKTIEIAKTKIDAYFTLRTRMPEMFSRRDPSGPDFTEAAEGVKIFFLPELTPEGYLVLVSREGNPDKFDHAHKTRRMAMMIELAMLLWPTQVNLMVVYDLRFFQPSLMSRLSPKHASQGLQWFQGSVPMKLKKVVAFNAPSFITIIINTFFKSCLKKKLFDRIHVYSSDETCLKEHIPLELLPEDYGGQQAGSDQLNNYWLEQLISHKDWFLREESKIVDESLRAKDTQHSGNMFGLDGTFKSLNID